MNLIKKKKKDVEFTNKSDKYMLVINIENKILE